MQQKILEKSVLTTILAITAMLIISVANAQIEGVRTSTPNDKHKKGRIDYLLQEVNVKGDCERGVYAQIVSEELAGKAESDEEAIAWASAAYGGDLTDGYGNRYKYPLPSGNFKGINYIERYNNLCIQTGCRTDHKKPQNNVTYPDRTSTKSSSAGTTYVKPSDFGNIDKKTILVITGIGVGLVTAGLIINGVKNAQIALKNEELKQQELNAKQEIEKLEKLEKTKEDADEILGKFKGEKNENKSIGLKNNPLEKIRTDAKPPDSQKTEQQENKIKCTDCPPEKIEIYNTILGM